jgi:hypothetical protein
MTLPSFSSLRPAGLAAAASAGVGSSRPPHISIDTNIFSLVDSTGNVKPLPPMIFNDGGQQRAQVALDVVFIDANPKPSKLYWGGKEYEKGSTEPPVCWSDNGIAPSTQALNPQNQVCVSCPHNILGSAISKFSGAKIRACQDFKKLACIIPDDPNGMIFLMQVKPGSFKNWTSMINWLKMQKTATGAAADLFDVVIRMTFESQGVLKFEPVAWVQEGTPVADRMVDAWSTKRGMLDEMVGKTDQPIQGLLAAPAQAQQIAAPVPSPPPQQGSAGVGASPSGIAGFPMPSPALQQVQAVQGDQTQKKRGRPKKDEPTPTPAPQPAFQMPNQLPSQTPPAADEDIPPFLRRSENKYQAALPPQANFGLVQPQAPSSDLQAKLAAAFKLPT